ncbi:hypothetical protein V8B97DRAFT_1996769, partial [Scleroderma yunnanense]
NAKPSFPNIPNLPALQLNDLIFPSSGIAQTKIWDNGKQDVLKKPKYKKKDLDKQRLKNLVPGTKLNPLCQDNRIPDMPIQHSTEILILFDNGQVIHGWTLLFPAVWSMAFLSSLVYTGTHFSGQHESGIPGFLVNYPSLCACEVASEQHAESEHARWKHTPESWEKLGTKSPWHADWDVVLGLKSPEATAATAEGLVTTQGETGQGNVMV